MHSAHAVAQLEQTASLQETERLLRKDNSRRIATARLTLSHLLRVQHSERHVSWCLSHMPQSTLAQVFAQCSMAGVCSLPVASTQLTPHCAHFYASFLLYHSDTELCAYSLDLEGVFVGNVGLVQLFLR